MLRQVYLSPNKPHVLNYCRPWLPRSVSLEFSLPLSLHRAASAKWVKRQDLGHSDLGSNVVSQKGLL